MTSSRTGKVIDIKDLVQYNKGTVTTCQKDWCRFSNIIKLNGFLVSDLIVIEYLLQKNNLSGKDAENFRQECMQQLSQNTIPEVMLKDENREAALEMIKHGNFLRKIWEIYLIDSSMSSGEKKAFLDFFEQHLHQVAFHLCFMLIGILELQ
ncbi:MAG: hypothetical protein ABI597_14205 [Gammaproteobacteria bacterium]